MLTLYVNKWPVCKALNYVERETRLWAPAADEVTGGWGGGSPSPSWLSSRKFKFTSCCTPSLFSPGPPQFPWALTSAAEGRNENPKLSLWKWLTALLLWFHNQVDVWHAFGATPWSPDLQTDGMCQLERALSCLQQPPLHYTLSTIKMMTNMLRFNPGSGEYAIMAHLHHVLFQSNPSECLRSRGMFGKHTNTTFVEKQFLLCSILRGCCLALRL